MYAFDQKMACAHVDASEMLQLFIKEVKVRKDRGRRGCWTSAVSRVIGPALMAAMVDPLQRVE